MSSWPADWTPLSILLERRSYLDQFDDAAEHAERALKVGRATGQGQLFPGIYDPRRCVVHGRPRPGI